MKRNLEISSLLEKPIWQLSGHEFVALLENSLNKLEKQFNDGSGKRYVYGLDGLKDLLGVSKSSAERVKKSGVLDKAIYQNNRTIVIDAELALKLFAERMNTKKKVEGKDLANVEGKDSMVPGFEQKGEIF